MRSATPAILSCALAGLVCGQFGCSMLATPTGQKVARTVVIEGGKKVAKKVGDELKGDDENKPGDMTEEE